MKKSLLLVALLLLVVATGVCTALGSADIVTQAEENSTTPTVTYVETEEDFLAFATNRYLASEGDKFILTSDIYLDRFYAESRTLKSLEYNSKNIAFNAIFDGRGHAVVGLKESLFSIIGESGVVKNLQLIGVNNVDNLTACSLAYTNNGTISGVEVSGDLQGSGFTAGLVQTNVGTIENCIVAVDMTGAKANDESVTYAYGLASGSGTITDSYGYGHGLGVTQGDEQVILGKSGLNTYTELNYTLAIGNPLKLGNALNLYNTPLISDANLELSIQNGYTLYNTDGLSSGVLENLEEFPAKTGTAELSNSTAPQGSGTKEDPYRISTPEELTYIDNFSSEDYAMLTAHIDLSAYTNTYFLSKLQCNFDGNGYTITLSVGSSGLAQSIYSEKSVEDYTELSDYMRVSDLFINAKLAQDVYSSVYNVTVKGNAVSFADVVWQNGVVMRSTLINHSESFVSTANKGMVAFNRFITDGGAPFANEGQVYGFYFATESSDTSEFLAMQGVEEAVMVDALSGEVLDYYGGDSELTLESKFGTADIYAWGYLYGQEKDIPKMVFPSDRAKYKSTLSLSGSYSYSDYVGTKKGTGEATITTLPVGTDTSVYATSNHDRVFTDSTLDYTNCYELLEADGATISKEAVEFIIKESLSSEVVTYLDNKTLTWNSIAGGEVTGAYFDSVGVYLLIYQDDVIYLCATLAVDNGGVAELSYEYIEEGVGNLKMLSNLNMQSILDSYENATVSYHLADGVTLAPTIISEVGSYVVKITIPSTTTTAGAVIKGEYTLNKGDFDFSGVTIASIGKGLSQDNATVYDGAEKDFLSELYYYGTEYQGITFSLNSIVSLEKQDGSFAYNLDSVVDAGKYTVLLNINVPGYNTITKTINFYVDRKAFAVDALYDGQSSVEFDYYTPFDGDKVSYYTSVADISLINFIENLSYDNYYYAGCNVGQYMITPVINASEIANNYDITAGVGALITVNPVKISLNPAKLSETLTYDGKEHVINVPEDAIIRNTTDTSAITYSVVGAVAKTSVGSYIQEIQVKLDSQNYLISDPCEATLTINPKPIKMGAKDAYVNYGEDAVYQAYAEVNDGVAIEENILEQIVLGTDYTLSSSYVVGETKAGGALPITLTLLNYTETAEGYLKGNYLIDKEIGVGALTVGKKSYAFDMETSYSYTGSPVALDFKGEIFDAEPSYKFYLLSGGNSYELGYTPTDACDSTYLYQVEVTVPESDSYYGATSEKITFAITPLDDTLSGLYVTAGGVTKPISEWSADVYSKTEYTISIDYSELTNPTQYKITYRYRLSTNTGESYDYESANPIKFTDVISIKDISVVVNGAPNFVSYTFDGYEVEEQKVAYTFELTPKAVSLPDFQIRTYRGSPYTEGEFTKWVNELAFLEGRAPIDGDEVTFTAKIPSGIVPMNPGSYAIEILSNNPNYYLLDVEPAGENYLVQTIVNGKATVDLDEVLPPETFEFGEITRPSGGGLPYIERTIRYALEEEAQATIKLFISVADHQGTFIAPGTYDIHSAEPIQEGDLIFVAFELKGASDKVVINPLKITFDWGRMLNASTGIKSNYVYDGTAIDYPTYFNNSMVSTVTDGLSKPGNPDVQVSIGGGVAFKHAGSYTFTATTNYTAMNADGQTVNCYEIDESVRTFTSVIAKKEVVYSITPVQITVGDPCPTTFEVVYPDSTKKPIASDTVTYAYNVKNFSSSVEGDFAVELSIRVQDGGKLYEDYTLTKLNPDAKELTVRLLEFESNLLVTDYTTTYSGEAVEVPVQNLPDGAEVHYSLKPTAQGTYSVSVSVSKQGYRTKTFSVVLVINKATPYIQFTGEKVMEYNAAHTLSHLDVNAVATFNGVEILGTFYFDTVLGQVPPMKLGTHTYNISFVPDSTNFSKVSAISYTITTYVEEEDVSVTVGEFDLGENLSAKGQVTISVDLPLSLQGAALLIVNGSACLDGTYTFTESENNVLIEVMLDNQVLYSKTVNVTIENVTPTPPVEPENPDTPNEPTTPSTPSTPTTPSTPSGDSDEKIEDDSKSNLGLIIGLSVGGGVVLIGGGVAIAIVIIKKKGGKNA